MSSIKLSPNASGTGIFTIAAPNSNTDRTLTLPDQTGTVLTNAGPFTANASASAGAVTIDASNNVGIGTSSPGARLHVQTSAGYNAYFQTSGTSVRINYLNDAASANVSAAYRATDFAWQKSDGAEVARIDSSGNLLVGTTSSGATQNGLKLVNPSGVSYIAIAHPNATGSGNYYAAFEYNAGLIGSIAQSGTTAVAYNTSSDYRLKENVQPMVGALAKVTALKPCTYTWKTDGSAGEGFIAHELAEVVPQCVTGEKDAVDAEGNPVYQGIDTSFLVATLTAAIQELKAELDAAKARIAALEAQP